MSISNIDDQILYLNTISNEDQAEPETRKEVDAIKIMVIDCIKMAARDKMFDELLGALELARETILLQFSLFSSEPRNIDENCQSSIKIVERFLNEIISRAGKLQDKKS